MFCVGVAGNSIFRLQPVPMAKQACVLLHVVSSRLQSLNLNQIQLMYWLFQVHELSGCGDFLSALELAQCVDDGAALVAGLHVAYGDDMFRKVTVHNTIQCFLSRCFSLAAAQGEFSGAMRQYAAGALPLRAILRRFPDLIQGAGDAAADGGSHPVMKGEDPKFVQAVVQLVRECERTAPPSCLLTVANRLQVSHVQAVRRQAVGVSDAVVDTALLRALVRVCFVALAAAVATHTSVSGEQRQCAAAAVVP